MIGQYIYDERVAETVLVVEDDPFVRRGVVEQIASSGSGTFEVAAEAATVAGAREAIEAGRATIGIFDLQLTDGNALPLIGLAASRGMAVLVLTVWDDDDSVYRALASGAGGYLLKSDAASGRVTEALSVLKDGGAPISPTIARRLLDDFRARQSSSGTMRAALSVATTDAPSSETSSMLALLTDREREIIDLFAKGATYDEVAKMLTMSVNTVRHHVRSIYRKLHVCSKAEAVTMAFRST